MARDTATLGEDGVLREYDRQKHLRVPVINLKDLNATHQWRKWLEEHSTFRYESVTGSFTARKDRRKDSFFWYATRRIRGKQRTVYLGADEAVTLERLEKAASELADRTDYQFEGRRWRELVTLFKQAGFELLEDQLGRWDWFWPSVMIHEPFQVSTAAGDTGFASPEEAMIDAMSHLLFVRLALPARRSSQKPIVKGATNLPDTSEKGNLVELVIDESEFRIVVRWKSVTALCRRLRGVLIAIGGLVAMPAVIQLGAFLGWW